MTSSSYVARTVSDLTPDPPPPHLIKNVCRVNGSILLFGPTGIGKSRLLWQMACAWGQGKSFIGLTPLRPLRITMVEADMYRADFEAMIKEIAAAGIPAPPSVCWFSRDDESPFLLDSGFGKTILEHNKTWDTDLTIYDAVPDIHIGDVNDQRIAYQTLRALQGAANSRAYLGVMVKRKGSTLSKDEEQESIDNMLGSQGWGRSASTVWQMTNTPSLVWVKHRLCQRPDPIIMSISTKGIFYSRPANAQQGVILDEAMKGVTSIDELVAKVMLRRECMAIKHPNKEVMLRSAIEALIAAGKLVI